MHHGPGLPPALPGKLLMVGFGSIGQAALPLLLRHFHIEPARIRIIKPTPDRSGVAARFGVEVTPITLGPANLDTALRPLLAPGDFLLNLAVNVSSIALVDLCRRAGVLYLDTCNEPWPGRHDNPSLTASERSNYALREELLALRRSAGPGPTAVVTQGANPGLISALLKQALLNAAADHGLDDSVPVSREGWAGLARRLGIRAIHISERDTQTGTRRKRRGEFLNTWSVEAFIHEGLQPAELGWGSHEKYRPSDARHHGYGCDSAILLERPGFSVRVRSWTPLEGPFHGFLVTHSESISIADFLTVRGANGLEYRPTVHYAYHPCDDAVLSIHELAGAEWRPQANAHVLCDDIAQGIDELGVLLMGPRVGAYWFGSRLPVTDARELAPCNNATTMQVVAGVLGGMHWALRHPEAGIVEPDEIDHRVVLDAARPYLGEVVGVHSDWTPLRDRCALFAEPADPADPWQFVNVRVA